MMKKTLISFTINYSNRNGLFVNKNSRFGMAFYFLLKETAPIGRNLQLAVYGRNGKTASRTGYGYLNYFFA